MNPEAVALGRVYAQALADSFPEEAAARAFAEELSALTLVLEETSGWREFLANPAMDAEQRQGLVERIFAARVSEPMASLLGLLAANRRLAAIAAIAAQFSRILDERARRITVTVRSAIPLSPEEQMRLEESLSDVLDAEIRLELLVDPDVVGGLRLQIGEAVYDASIAGSLAQLKDAVSRHR
jgi:F-type H+-transporting ATPase subunit delta